MSESNGTKSWREWREEQATKGETRQNQTWREWQQSQGAPQQQEHDRFYQASGMDQLRTDFQGYLNQTSRYFSQDYTLTDNAGKGEYRRQANAWRSTLEKQKDYFSRYASHFGEDELRQYNAELDGYLKTVSSIDNILRAGEGVQAAADETAKAYTGFVGPLSPNFLEEEALRRMQNGAATAQTPEEALLASGYIKLSRQAGELYAGLQRLYSPGTAANEGRLREYQDRAESLLEQLAVAKAYLENNRSVFQDAEYESLRGQLEQTEQTLRGIQNAVTPFAGAAAAATRTNPLTGKKLPSMDLLTADTDRDGRTDSVAPGGDLGVWQRQQAFEPVSDKLEEYTNRNSYGRQSLQQQKEYLEESLHTLEYVSEHLQADGTLDASGVGALEEKKNDDGSISYIDTKRPPSDAELRETLLEADRRLNYMMLAQTMTEEEFGAAFDRLYAMNEWYRERTGEDVLSLPDRKTMLAEYRYQQDTYTRENIPIRNNTAGMLVRVARLSAPDEGGGEEDILWQEDIERRLLLGYLANTSMTKAQYDQYMEILQAYEENGRLPAEELQTFRSQREKNGQGENREGQEKALQYYPDANAMTVLESSWLGGQQARDTIFQTAPGMADELLTHGLGYVVQGIGWAASALGIEGGQGLQESGEEMQQYRSDDIAEVNQRNYNRGRAMQEVSHNSGKFEKWMLENVPGMTQSLVQMAATSMLGSAATAAAPAATTASAAASPLMDVPLSTKVFSWAARNASLLPMAGLAGASDYAEHTDLAQEDRILHALASGAVEYGSEKLFGGNPLLDSEEAGAVTRAIYALTENKTIRKIVSSQAADWIGEGLEEVISSLGSYALDYAMFGKAELDPEQLGNDFIAGVLISSLMIGGEKAVEGLSRGTEYVRYANITKFSPEAQSSREALNAEMMRYEIEYLGGDRSLLRNHLGMDDAQIDNAIREWDRIVGEYNTVYDRLSNQEQTAEEAEEAPEGTDAPYHEENADTGYLEAVDENVLNFLQEVEDGKTRNGQNITIGTLDEPLASKLTEVTGTDVHAGDGVFLNSSTIQHILKRHGKNGKADHSMQNPEDIARIWYVIRNYDNIEAGGNTSKEYRNRDNTPGKKVVITKQIDGTYYVVEAVTDAGKVGIVSAYISKKAGASQVPDARPNRSPLATSGNELVSTPNSNIAQNGTDVKRFVRERVPGEVDQTEDFELMRDALRDEARDWSDARLAREIENARAVRDDIGQTDSNREYQQYRLDALEPEQQARQENTAVTPAENGGKTNGRGTRISDDSSQRDAGLGAGEQAGSMEKGAGESVHSGKRATEASLIARVKAAGSTAARSAAEIGVEDGGKSKTLYVLPEEIVAQSPRWTAIRENAASRGARTVFFAGILTVRNSVTGSYDAVEGLRQTGRDGQTTYYIKVDKMQRNAQQIYLHEIFHDAVAQNRGLLLNLTEELYRRYGKQEIARLVNDYVSAYRGIYGVFTEGMTADEQAELELRYLEELFADLYAGIRRGQVNSDSAQSVMENRRGDIDRETSRATRDTRGAPEQRFSAEENTEAKAFLNELTSKIPVLQNMEPVYQLTGKEFAKKDNITLLDQVLEEYKRFGNTVFREGFGNVIFTRSKIKADIMHGFGRNKACAFAAVPSVIQKGKQISYEKNWKNRGYDTYIFAAPVRYGTEITYVGVIVQSDTANRFYLHEIVDSNGYLIKIDKASNHSRTVPANMPEPVQPDALSKFMLSDEAQDVKQKFSVEDDTIPENAEAVHQAARAEKERRADAASINTLKNRVQASEEAIKAQKAALRALREGKLLTRDVEEQIKGKIQAIQETLQIDREALGRKQAEKTKAERVKREKAKQEEIQRQRAVIAQKELRQDLMNLFSVKVGVRSEMADAIDTISDEIVRSGRITEDNRRALFEALLNSGEMVAEADDYTASIRASVREGRIYVSEEVRTEFGDDWEAFRRRAWANRIYLTNQPTDAGIDVWTEDLASSFGTGYFSGENDLRTQLETIVSLAEEGREERLSIPEMIQRNADQYGWSVDEQIDDLERKMDQTLETFAQKANLEIRLRQKSMRQLMDEQAYFRRQIENRRNARMESAAREQVMRSIQKLQRMRRKSSPEYQRQIDETLKGIDTVARSISARGLEDLQELARRYYEERDKQGNNFLRNPYVEGRIARLGETQLDKMDIQTVRELGRTVNGIVNSIQNSNKLLAQERAEEISKVAKQAYEEINASKGSDGGALRKILVEHMTPSTFLGQISGWKDGAMRRLAEGLENGQLRQFDYQRRAMRIFDGFLAKKENVAWIGKAAGEKADFLTYTVPVYNKDGKLLGDTKIEITPMMRVSLYMHSLNEDNLRHIQEGGIRIPRKALYKKGKISEAYARGEIVKMQPETVRGIAADCTAQELEFARLLQKYYDGLSKDCINEVSMKLDGFERAGGKHYYHIKTDSAFRAKENQAVTRDLSVENIGSVVNERKHAGNPIVLEDATDALQEHIKSISKYYAYTLPIRDLNAVLSYTFHEDGNAFTGSVTDALNRKWGSGAEQYIDKIMADLQQQAANDARLGRFFAALRGRFARAKISLNPSSTLKQTSSYFTALPYLGISDMLYGVTPKRMREDVATLERYSSVYWYRNQGNSTMELGDATARRQFGDRLPLGYGWAQRMDSAVTRRLLAACEHKVSREMGLTPGTQEEIAAGTDRYWREVAKLFNDVVLRTQSNSSMMERPQIARAPEGNLARFLTMFRSDDFQQFNLLTSAFGKFNAARNAYRENHSAENSAALKDARAFAAKTVAGTLLSKAWAALIVFAIKALKQKDRDYRNEEGEIDAGEVFKQLGIDIAESYAGLLIGGDTLASAIEVGIGKLTGGSDAVWYGEELNVFEAINDLGNTALDVFGALGSADWRKGAGAIKSFAQTTAETLGLPVDNLETYLLALTKWIAPEWAERYENLWQEKTKADLPDEVRRNLTAAISVILDNRTDDLSDESKEEIARLYTAGYTAAVPSALPRSVTYSGEDGNEITVTLNQEQQRQYRQAWNRTVSGTLEQLLSSEAYENADDEDKAALVGRLYQYAGQIAKHEAVPEKEPDRWVEQGERAVADGIPLAEYIVFHEELSDINGKDADGNSVSGLAAQRKMELLESMGWTDAQEKGIYLDIVASESKAAETDALIKAGLNWEQAQDVVKVPSAKAWEHMNAIIQTRAGEKAKVAALEVYANPTEIKLIQTGVNFGIKLEWYAEVRNNADADKNGRLSQAEVTEYIYSMGLTVQESAYLWQMVTDGKHGKENPFSTACGETFWDTAHDED